jgi:N4-gp56 family major capsid protein
MAYNANNAAAYNVSTNPGGMADDVYTNLLADAQFAAYETSIARNFVTTYDVGYNTGKVIQVPVYSAVTASALTEGTAPSASTSNAVSVDITLAELGTYFQVTDLLRDAAERDVMQDLGYSAGRAIGEKMDTDVFALFNSFTQSVGTEDSAITLNNILEAVATLRAAKVSGPLVGVIGPRQALQLKKELVTNANFPVSYHDYGTEVARSGLLGTFAGVQMFESSLVKSDLDTDTDTELNMVGAIFAPSAIGHAMRGGIVMETQRQAASRATEVMMTATCGQAILQNTHGVKIVGSASD